MADEARPQAHSREVAARDGLRASHEDRDNVVEQLRVAGGDGRLDADELDERVGAALVARTYGELAALVSDLPAPPGSSVVAPTVRSKDVVRIQCSGGNANRDGRWAVPQRMEVSVHGGNVKLDFTEADISWPTLQIDVGVGGGNLTLITKPGIVVDADDVTVFGGNVKVKAPWVSGVPIVLRIEVTGRVAGGNITARPPRRSLWVWLRRGPHPYALPAGRR
jgi:Domain of unknown function (DUF1707)